MSTSGRSIAVATHSVARYPGSLRFPLWTRILGFPLRVSRVHCSHSASDCRQSKATPPGSPMATTGSGSTPRTGRSDPASTCAAPQLAIPTQVRPDRLAVMPHMPGDRRDRPPPPAKPVRFHAFLPEEQPTPAATVLISAINGNAVQPSQDAGAVIQLPGGQDHQCLKLTRRSRRRRRSGSRQPTGWTCGSPASRPRSRPS
jgi:hypothetical protein